MKTYETCKILFKLNLKKKCLKYPYVTHFLTLISKCSSYTTKKPLNNDYLLYFFLFK